MIGPEEGPFFMNTQDINRRIRLIMELRSKGMNDTKVLGAMERVPREKFVPESVKHQAWDDIALPIGRGQTISQPYIVASMTAALQLSDRDKVLEIGTGSGYQACILSKLCRRVYTIERHKPLLDSAEKLFREFKLGNVTTICGDGTKGWPKSVATGSIATSGNSRLSVSTWACRNSAEISTGT